MRNYLYDRQSDRLTFIGAVVIVADIAVFCIGVDGIAEFISLALDALFKFDFNFEYALSSSALFAAGAFGATLINSQLNEDRDFPWPEVFMFIGVVSLPVLILLQLIFD